MARIRVEPAAGGRWPAPAVAFAAVDEGLLALRANDSWDLLDAMIQRARLGRRDRDRAERDHRPAPLRPQGRRRPAAAAAAARRASCSTPCCCGCRDVALDGNGEATVEVPLNDSLTSFRFVAVADADVAQVRHRQHQRPRHPGPADARRACRRWCATATASAPCFTLRNTTDARHEGEGDPAGHREPARRDQRRDDARAARLRAAGRSSCRRRRRARSPGRSTSRPARFGIAWEAAADAAGVRTDRLKMTQLVARRRAERVLQATLVSSSKAAFSLPVAAARRCAAGERTQARRHARRGAAAGSVPRCPGIRRFFATYPFSCLEQKASKSIGLNDAALWAGVANALPTYLDGDGLASYFPPTRRRRRRTAATRLTAYLLAAAHEAGFELPAPAREAMLARPGRVRRGPHRAPLLVAARRTSTCASSPRSRRSSRYGRAQPRMLGSINLTPNVWPTAALIDWLCDPASASTASPSARAALRRGAARSCAAGSPTPARR